MNEFITCFLCAYNEEKMIERTCKSLVRQTVDFDELLLIDSGSTDATVDIALSYVDDVVQAPKGKLSARNYAISPPLNAPWDGPQGDIIVNTDADKRYIKQWAELILRHFNDPEIVGVTGETRYKENGEDTLHSSIADTVEVGLRGWVKYLFSNGYTLEGGNSAFRKQTFEAAGMFDTSWVNQQEIWQVFHEEEFYLPYRMSKFGEIIVEGDAIALEPPRRIQSLLPGSEYGNKIAQEHRM